MGKKRMLLVGIGVFSLASLLCGLAPSIEVLIAARAAQGGGAAVMMAMSIALVGGTVPKARTGSAMGMLGAMSAIGTTLGPSLGGLLIAVLGWRAVFLVNVPVGILNFLLVLRFLPADSAQLPARGARLDILGTAVLTATLAAYALSMTLERTSSGTLNAILFLTSLVGVGVFVAVEAHVSTPLVQLKMFLNPTVSASLAMSTLVSTVMMVTLVVGPFYLAQVLGLPPDQMGITLAVGPLVAALLGVPAGRLVDRFGTAATTIGGLSAIATGASVLALLPESFGVAGYLMPIVVITSGYALFQAANNTAILAGTLPDQRGVISGMLSLARNIGLITGASVMGAVFAGAVGTRDISFALPEIVAHGVRITFGLAGGLMVLTLAIAVLSASRRSFTVRGDMG